VAGSDTPRPAVVALRAWIEAERARQRAGPASSVGSSLLMLAPRLQSIPACLIRDSVLAPVDKLAWMVIFQAAVERGGMTVFPSYEVFTNAAHLGSSATVSRALAVLRIQRWMTVRARDAGGPGPLCGPIYTLHGEGLGVADASFLDPGYVGFLETARTHHHARVRALAIDEYERCAGRMESSKSDSSCSAEMQGRTAQAARGSPHLNNESSGTSDSEALQNSKSCCSSKQQHNQTPKTKNTTTTDVPNEVTPKRSEAVAAAEALVFPDGLPAAHHPMAAQLLAGVPVEDRQAILDELAGRLAQSGRAPVQDPLRYLRGLCERAARRDFVPSLGIAVRNGRARASATPDLKPPQALPTLPEPADREVALRHLADIRASLGKAFRVNAAPSRGSGSDDTEQ